MFKLDAVNGFQIFVVLRFSFVILISIAMAKVGLPLAEIGVYEALMLVGATFTFFWMTGLMNGILPTYPTLSEEERPAFIFNVFVLLVVASAFVTGLMWCFRDVLTQMMTNFETLPYFHWLCLYLAINLPTFIVEYLYILLNKPKPIIGFGLFSFGGQFLVVILPLFFGWSLEWSFIGLVVLAVLKYLWLVPLLIKHSKIDWQFQRLVPYFGVAFPIIIYTFVGGIMAYIDGTIIMKYFDESQFAIYRNGAREFPLSLALLTAMSTALVPNISEHLKSGLGQIKHRTGKLMVPLFGASIFLMFISPIAYPIVFREDFADSAWVFNVYLLVLINRILLPQTILIGLKETKIILITSIIETTINLGLSLILIEYLGLVGVALATMIAFTVEKIILVIYCSIKLKIGLAQYLDVKRYSLCSVLLLGSYFLSQMLY